MENYRLFKPADDHYYESSDNPENHGEVSLDYDFILTKKGQEEAKKVWQNYQEGFENMRLASKERRPVTPYPVLSGDDEDNEAFSEPRQWSPLSLTEEELVMVEETKLSDRYDPELAYVHYDASKIILPNGITITGKEGQILDSPQDLPRRGPGRG